MEIIVRVELGQQTLNVLEKLLGGVSVNPQTTAVVQDAPAKNVAKTAPVAKAEKSKPEPTEKTLSVEDVQTDFVKYFQSDRAGAIDLLKRHGATKGLSTVPVENLSALLAELQEIN